MTANFIEYLSKLTGAGVKLLKYLRDKPKWSGYETAKRLKIPVNTYYYYENTAHTIPLNVLVKIRRAFDLTWAELGALVEEEFSDPPPKKRTE